MLKKFSLSLLSFLSIVIIVSSCQEDKDDDKSMELGTVEFIVTNASSYNASDGSIEVVLNDMEEPYFFQWSNGDTSKNIEGLEAGEYTLGIVFGESYQNYFEGSAVVEQPSPEPLDITANITDVVTYDHAEGVIELAISGGTPPYSIKWENGDTLKTVEELFAGNYTVTVTDASEPFRISTEATFSVNQPEFVCGRDSVRDIDGNMYATVQIGDQCWMQQNLRTLRNPNYPDSLVYLEGVYCFKEFCEGIEGAHYTYSAMLNGDEAAEDDTTHVQGIAPDGWRIPTPQDFNELQEYLSVDGNGGSGFFAGAKMKGIESTSGFDALLIGNWGFGIYNKAPQASFWVSKEFTFEGETEARDGFARYVTDDTPFLNGGHFPKNYGLSVRLIRNDE